MPMLGSKVPCSMFPVPLLLATRYFLLSSYLAAIRCLEGEPLVFDILSRRNKDREKYGDRLPPGQKLVEDWPVLTYGGVPRTRPGVTTATSASLTTFPSPPSRNRRQWRCWASAVWGSWLGPPAGAGNGSRCKAADAVRFQPFARRGGMNIVKDIFGELDHDFPTCIKSDI